jgi:hypothetical protein
MKSLLLALLSLAFLIGCATKKPPEPAKTEDIVEKEIKLGPTYLWAFKPGVNIRETNVPSAPKMAQLSDGDSVAVLANRNGWYQVRTEESNTGWVRTDLLGPKNLSAFRRAVSFVDSLHDKEMITVFFDKKLYHKRIYISFPIELYSSKSVIESKTRKLVDNFQARVYRGEVTARVLKPGTEEEYLTIVVKGVNNADPLLPIIPFGIISKVIPKYAQGIKIEYEIPTDVPDQQLLDTARKLSGEYPLTYQMIEFTFVDESDSATEQCRLWFREDENGEDYKFSPCP